MRPGLRCALAAAVVLALAGCAVVHPDGGAARVAPVAPSGSPVASASTSPSPSTAWTPSPAPPSPTLTPSASPLPAPTASELGTLPDARTGAALARPLLVRGIPLINAQHPVSSAFKPTLRTKYQLAPDAHAAFVAMVAAAKADGKTLVWRVGYRSYTAQAQLYATPPAEYGDEGQSYVAKPGTSEHQSGLAVDVGSPKGRGSDFAATAEFAWLRKHSYKYGWILRYPQGKKEITGIEYEPWHFRYVPATAASEFGPASQLTLEEYLGGR